MFIKVLLILIFFGIMIGVGIVCRKQARDVRGFVLGGRNVGPWLSAFAFGTSYFSAVIFVGYAGQFGWKFGLASTWIGLGNAFIGSLLAWIILGRRTRIMTQHLHSATMPQFFENRFNSKSLKLISSIIIFIFLIPYTASLYNGLSRLFGMGFNVDYTICIIVMAVLTAIYVIAGGYMATAVNDFIQGIIMLIGIVAIIGSVLRINGGFVPSLDALARVQDSSVSGTPGVFASFFGPDPFSLLCVVILTSLGTWGLPQMVQKFYAIKSEKDIHKGTVISTFFAIVVAGGCYFLGGFGRLFNVNVATEGYDAIIPAMLANLSPVIFGIALVLVLSASMSTLSSLVLASSSTLTLDFIDPVFMGNRKDEKRNLPIISVHPDLRGHSDHPVQEECDLHSSAHGPLLGSSGRFIPCPVPLQPVLEEDHKGKLHRMLHLGFRADAGEHVLQVQLPGSPAEPDQLRSLGDAGRNGHSTGSKRIHTQA